MDRATSHTGGEDVDDFTVKVPESQYKRHYLVQEGFLLLVAVLVWVEGARRANSSEIAPKKLSSAMLKKEG